MALTTDQRDRIREKFAAFLDNRAKNLERTTA